MLSTRLIMIQISLVALSQSQTNTAAVDARHLKVEVAD